MSTASAKKLRPKYLTLPAILFEIRLPLPGWVSILHRVSGALLVFIWAYCHHFCAGIRFLLLDLNKGIELRQARISSVIVLVVSLALTAVFGARLW